jgi:hypothetical protein
VLLPRSTSVLLEQGHAVCFNPPGAGTRHSPIPAGPTEVAGHMLYAPHPAPVQLPMHAGLRVLTLPAIALLLALLLLLTSLLLPWPAVPLVQAGSANAITWQQPLSGPVGTVASITGIAGPLPAGAVFNLDLRPGQGQLQTEHAAICTSTTLPKVYIGQVTSSSNHTFAKKFGWPAAAGQLGAWSICSYQRSGQMASAAQAVQQPRRIGTRLVVHVGALIAANRLVQLLR